MTATPIVGIRAITLDFGGTLLTPHPSVGAVYAEILAQHGVTVATPLLDQRFRKNFADVQAQPRSVINESTEYAFWREVVYRTLAPECPPVLLQPVFIELYSAFVAAERWRILPGAAELLYDLSTRTDV